MKKAEKTPDEITELVTQYALPILSSTFEMADNDIDRYSTKENHRFALVIVFNQNAEFLILQNDFRDWGWEIPGGNVEPTESYEEAAKRETLEEAGVTVKHLVPVCVIQAEIVSPSYRIGSWGVAFSTIWSGTFLECEKETTLRKFVSEVPERSKFLNGEVIRMARLKFDQISAEMSAKD
jgi:8-oxo-dGTP pyrophosphatase MutT (NUDIX family)